MADMDTRCKSLLASPWKKWSLFQNYMLGFCRPVWTILWIQIRNKETNESIYTLIQNTLSLPWKVWNFFSWLPLGMSCMKCQVVVVRNKLFADAIGFQLLLRSYPNIPVNVWSVIKGFLAILNTKFGPKNSLGRKKGILDIIGCLNKTVQLKDNQL